MQDSDDISLASLLLPTAQKKWIASGILACALGLAELYNGSFTKALRYVKRWGACRSWGCLPCKVESGVGPSLDLCSTLPSAASGTRHESCELEPDGRNEAVPEPQCVACTGAVLRPWHSTLRTRAASPYSPSKVHLFTQHIARTACCIPQCQCAHAGDSCS